MLVLMLCWLVRARRGRQQVPLQEYFVRLQTWGFAEHLSFVLKWAELFFRHCAQGSFPGVRAKVEGYGAGLLTWTRLIAMLEPKQ